jgi:hypothetical protein
MNAFWRLSRVFSKSDCKLLIKQSVPALHLFEGAPIQIQECIRPVSRR